jgi:glycosyltransferase involved in cell wall biosynthesis
MPDDAPRHLFHAFSTFGIGGPQIRFVSIANALGRKFRHTVLAMDDNFAAADGLRADIDVAFAKIPVVKSTFLSLSNLRNARRLLKASGADLLVTYNWGAIEWAIANFLLPCCPQLHIEDGFGPDESPILQNPKRIIMRRIFLSRCARIIVPSRTLFELATTRWRLSPRQVIELPNGINVDRFAAEPDAALLMRLGIPEGVPVVGTVATLRREKNLPRLVQAFAALPRELDARLVIVGDGPERERIGATAADLGIQSRVVLAGRIMEPERILRRFDVFALSSDTEQMPNSALEAMAAGLAIVTTDVGDLKRMVVPENGPYVVPLGNDAALSEALAALLTDSRLRKEIGQKNQSRVKSSFAEDKMVTSYETLFATN